MTIKVSTIKETDVMRMHAAVDKLSEISKGDWIEQPMASPEHARIGAALSAEIYIYLKTNPIGKVYGADACFVLEGTPENIITMRLPDVAFVAAERVQAILEGCYYLAPDLAVEVISPSERRAQIEQKRQEYLRAGVRQVWEVYPAKKHLIVYLPDGTSTVYTDSVPGGHVLPGFELKLTDLFE